MEPTHVYYSNDVGAPASKITLGNEDLYYKLQEITEAENDENARYAHYYYAQEDDYENTEYIYVSTTNA